MKKIITGFLTAAIVICIGTIGIYALGQDSETSAATTKTTAVSTESTAATTAVSQSTTRQTTSSAAKIILMTTMMASVITALLRQIKQDVTARTAAAIPDTIILMEKIIDKGTRQLCGAKQK